MSSKLLFVCVLVLSTRSGLFSIFFDEYDPNVIPQDIYDVDVPCFHIGSRCDVTEDCCGPATCVLPSWSPTPVCLVPGYKEDEKLARMSSHDPPRREDILYLHNTYNTTFFDFLLSDLTTASARREEAEVIANFSSSSGTGISSGTGDAVGSPQVGFGSNKSELRFSSGEATEGTEELKTSSDNKFFKGRILKFPLKAQDFLQNKLRSSETDFETRSEDKGENIIVLKFPRDLKKLFNEFKLVLDRRHRFLLINTNVTENMKRPTINEIYEAFRNSDQYKIIIELLQEKLKRLNEKENSGSINMNLDILGKTQSSTTAPETSKWNVVRQFFFQKTSNGGNTVNKNKFVKTSKEAITELEKREGIEELMEKFSERHNVDRNIKDNTSPNDHKDGGGIMEVFNIKIPCRINQNGKFEASKETQYLTFSLIKPIKLASKNNQRKNYKNTGDTLFKNISPKSSEDNMELAANNIEVDMLNYQKYLNQSFNTIKETLQSLKRKNVEKSIQVSSRAPELKSKSVKVGQSKNSKHSQTAHNASTKLTDKLKHLFVWNTKPELNKSVHPESQVLRLNEHLLLAVNSKNFSEKMANYFSQSETNERDSPEVFFDSSLSKESVSHDSKALYNNSYVFVIQKGNLSQPKKKQSKLSSILQFFHGETKSIPRPNNPCVNSSGNLCSWNKSSVLIKETASSRNVTTEEVIKLPESLMPEALELRQSNDSSDFWFFDDSEETVNEVVEQHTGFFNFVLF